MNAGCDSAHEVVTYACERFGIVVMSKCGMVRKYMLHTAPIALCLDSSFSIETQAYISSDDRAPVSYRFSYKRQTVGDVLMQEDAASSSESVVIQPFDLTPFATGSFNWIDNFLLSYKSVAFQINVSAYY